MSDAYARTGVSYEVLDAAKRAALGAARSTSEGVERAGAELVEASRGEPASVVALGERHLGFVLECLGTKSEIARGYLEQCGRDHYDAIGYDTVAAAVNDCCCVGALPFVVNAYFATGSASFYDGPRASSLVAGFARACVDAGAAWGGGESPTLSGLIAADAIDLAASAVGLLPEGVAPVLGEDLVAGDEIVLVSSSGLHANGASLAREVAASLAAGYAHELPSGASLGDALLSPSTIYVELVRRLLAAKVPVHYLSHVTGHGLRKLMRAKRAFTYRVERLLEVPEVLSFLVERAGLSPRDAYATFNMGAGFAVFVAAGSGGDVTKLAAGLGHVAIVAGRIEEGPRSVVLEPVSVAYSSTELELS